MRLGLALGFEDSLGLIVDLASRGEAAGFESMYVVEAGRSASVPAAAVIGATSECRVGTYVVNAYAREPWLTGLVARDLDAHATCNPFSPKVSAYATPPSVTPAAALRTFLAVTESRRRCR